MAKIEKKKMPRYLYVAYEYDGAPDYVPLMADENIGQLVTKNPNEVGFYELKERMIAHIDSGGRVRVKEKIE